MINDQYNVEFLDTRFIFDTNFANDPTKWMGKFPERYGSGNVIIKDAALAQALMAEGYYVQQSNPTSDKYKPEWFVRVYTEFKADEPLESRNQPKIILVDRQNRTRLDAESVVMLDKLQHNHEIANIKVMCHKWNNPEKGKPKLFVQTMYAEKTVGNDPYAQYYENTDVPFDM